jgi:thiamine biosynthesis lipoprotein
MIEHETVFDAMGSQVRLVIGAPDGDEDSAVRTADRERRFVADFAAALSRFDPESELSALNADPRQVVPASELLRAAVRAGTASARLSRGLVDPTLLGEIESAGYIGTWEGSEVTLVEAIATAPPRRPARPRPESLWSRFEVDDDAGTVSRPAGVGLDTGGIGKGLSADLIAARLAGFPRFVVDCGGDIRIGGADALVNPYEVFVEHPLTGERVYALRLGLGGVATSGLNVRIWRGDDGRPLHHLLDPSTGEPAWTGLIGATALGDTAVEAEAVAKAALLSGPDDGRAVLSERGGLLVHDDGRVEKVGPLSARRL